MEYFCEISIYKPNINVKLINYCTEKCCYKPSIWYAEVATPHKKSEGNLWMLTAVGIMCAEFGTNFGAFVDTLKWNNIFRIHIEYI